MHRTYTELEEKINNLGGEGKVKPMQQVEKMMLLRSIDMLWVEHIDAMDHLRTGIGLRGYGQKDPLVEYKREAYQMFVSLQNNIAKQLAYSIFKIGATPKEEGQQQNLEMKKDSINSYKLGETDSKINVARPARAGAVSSSAIKAAPVEKKIKVGRNEPCPCGSGKKYKKCHGA
jgi:preprotein translocase subunit SecA